MRLQLCKLVPSQLSNILLYWMMLPYTVSFITCKTHTALFQTSYIKDITQPNSVKVVQSCTLVKIIYFS